MPPPASGRGCRWQCGKWYSIAKKSSVNNGFKLVKKILALPKAIIFDVDGTLYDQGKLRLYMLWEMLQTLILQPWRWRDLLIVWNFRRARSKNSSHPVIDLENQQYIWGAQVSKVTPEKVRRVVQEWILERPLLYLRRCRYPGTAALFSQLRKQGIHIGIFSDYPAQEKLEALGLIPEVVLCATDPEVDRFKPDPKGLLVTAAKLRVAPQDSLVIGDQDDKDGECARRAGMPYLIIDRRRRGLWKSSPSFVQLAAWVERCPH